MTLMNRLEIQGLCAKIAEVVSRQELDFCYDQGSVRVSVLSGERAKVNAEFMKALGQYVMATRYPGPSTNSAQAKEDLMKALDEYTAKVKL